MSDASVKLKMNYKTLCYHAKRLGCFSSNQSGKGINKIQKEGIIPLTDIFSGKHLTMQTHKLKKRLLKEGYKCWQCECCKNDSWLGQSIPLELHHQDGNRFNNALENLKLLCPNCHALTENYRAKNIKNLSASKEILNVESLNVGEACPIGKLNGNPEPSSLKKEKV
jgi:hypothetical protein